MGEKGEKEGKLATKSVVEKKPIEQKVEKVPSSPKKAPAKKEPAKKGKKKEPKKATKKVKKKNDQPEEPAKTATNNLGRVVITDEEKKAKFVKHVRAEVA